MTMLVKCITLQITKQSWGKYDDYWNWTQESLDANQIEEFINADIIQVFDTSNVHDYTCYRKGTLIIQDLSLIHI